MGGFVPAPFSPRSQWNALRPSLKRSTRVIDNVGGSSFASSSVGSGSQPITIHTNMALQDQFDFVRVVYFNDTANPWDIDQVIVASTASLTNQSAPVADAAGRGGSWATVPFNGGGVPTDWFPERYLAGMTEGSITKGITVPAPVRPTGFTLNQKLVVSDWVPLTSAARSDGQQGSFLMIRTFNNGSRGVATNVIRCQRVQPGTDFTTAWQQVGTNRGRVVQNFSSASDGVTTAGNINTYSSTIAAAANYEYVPVFFVEYMSRSRAVTIAGFGDSLTSGSKSTGQFGSAGLIAAAALSRPSLPVEWVNGGSPGAPSLIYHYNCAQQIPIIKPDIALIAIFSPNDGTPPTATTIDDGFRRAMNLAKLTMDNGGTPILWTPPPCAACTTVAADNLRKDLVARVKGMGASGFLVVDVDGILSDGGSIAQIKAPYNSGDNTHPSDAGYAAWANQGLIPKIQPLLS